jgi:hypothetical protein
MMSGGINKRNVRLAGGEDVFMQVGMESYPRAAVERAMKTQEVILLSFMIRPGLKT